MVRPGGFELPTFWFVGGLSALHGTTAADNTQRNQRRAEPDLGWRWMTLYPVHGQSHGQFSRKFSEIAVVILISPVALGAGNFPCCKPDEGNRVFFRSAWSHVVTKNYSVTAFRVFALDAIISVYGQIAHLAALEASRLSILRCNQADRHANLRIADGFSEIRTTEKAGASAHIPDVPQQLIESIQLAGTVREYARDWESGQTCKLSGRLTHRQCPKSCLKRIRANQHPNAEAHSLELAGSQTSRRYCSRVFRVPRS